MHRESQKANIIADLGAKRSTYYEDNYTNKSNRNYLRRLRSQLIRERLSRSKFFENVLDAGCGPAIIYKELLERSARYYALDMVQTNLDEIKNTIRAQNLEFICEDLDHFKWKECFFDVIVCSGAIEYTSYPKRNLVKLLSFLKPGGTLVCSFPNMLSPYRTWSEYVYKYAWKLKNKALGKVCYTYPRKLFSHASICKLLRDTQVVESIDTRYFGQKLLLQPLDNLFGNLDFEIVHFFERCPLWLTNGFCSEFVITVTRSLRFDSDSTCLVGE